VSISETWSVPVFVQAVLAALLVVLILGIFGWIKFKRDEKIVARFLQDAGIETGNTCRTTKAIASATNLSEVRIRKVCSMSSVIERHQDEKESWKVS